MPHAQTPQTPTKNRHNSGQFSALDKLSCASGNDVTSRITYLMSDMILVHPLKSSSYLGDCIEQFAEKGQRNCSGQVCHVEKLDTTVGCGSALMGMLSQGVSASVLCSSPSLLEIIPKLHVLTSRTWRKKLRDFHSSCVFHVSAFGFDNDLSLLSDYSNILYASKTGVAQIHSLNVQECHDMALISYLAASRVHLPFLHFFDGVRTGKEVSKVKQITFDKLTKLKELYTDHAKQSSVVDDVSTRKPLPSRGDIPDIVDDIMSKMQRVLKHRYSLFEYVGSGSAEHVIVSLCSQSETLALSDVVKQAGRRVGMVSVRLFRPWSSAHFFQVLPRSVKRVVVVSSVNSSVRGQLLADVSVSMQSSHHSCQVLSAQFHNTKSFGFDQTAVLSLLQRLDEPNDQKNIIIDCAEFVHEITSLKAPNAPRKILFWDRITNDEGVMNAGMDAITLLGDHSRNFVHGFQVRNCYQPGSGTAVSYLHFNSLVFPSPALDMSPHCVFCNHISILNQFNIVGELEYGGILVLNISGNPTEPIEQIVPTALKRDVAQREIRLYSINVESLLEELELEKECLRLILQIAIFSFSGLWMSTQQVSTFLKEILNIELVLDAYGLTQDKFLAVVDATLQAPMLIEVPETWKDAQDFEEVVVTKEDVGTEMREEKGEEKGEDKEEEETQLVPIIPVELPIILTPSLISCSNQNEEETCSVSGWYKAAWSFMFPDAHDNQCVQRPFEHEQVYAVRVQENRRLTPASYSRNVFHIEFNTSESGLKYAIGDALGIYPHNHPEDVNDFLRHCDVDPTQSVSVNIGGKSEIRTVEQVFTQVLDLFGRPGRRFYESLSKFAQDQKEKAKLEFLGSSDGGPAFKKRVDDTVTFADLIKEFSSCKLTIPKLMEIIPHIKPRHYSIASAQSMHPDSVHLLVVLVEWNQPSTDKPRFGLCTRYLDDLKVGDQITVSLKPSIMTLPEDPTAPIIMSGLGTGMAPFRAFIEERAVLHTQGVSVGPMVLYMGSRSQWKEYLYGEELEAYHQSGLLTTLRCAFSRDQEHKIYIQHLMQEDSSLICDHLHKSEGTFYLCGPTWPVADVEAAIISAFVADANMNAADAKEYIRGIKEDERYVLEVY